MFVPDRLKANAFRVLRLSADATLSDVHRAAGELRRAALLEANTATEADVPALGDVSRSEADIRAAVGRLENPEQRIADRLFWFYSVGVTTPVRQSLKKHDLALREIFDTFAGSLDEECIWRCARALRSWHQVVLDDDYWALVCEFETEGGFEPAAFPSEFEELRSKAVEFGPPSPL